MNTAELEEVKIVQNLILAFKEELDNSNEQISLDLSGLICRYITYAYVAGSDRIGKKIMDTLNKERTEVRSDGVRKNMIAISLIEGIINEINS